MSWQEMNASQKKLTLVHFALGAAFIVPILFFTVIK
jgi:hypothetical protein